MRPTRALRRRRATFEHARGDGAGEDEKGARADRYSERPEVPHDGFEADRAHRGRAEQQDDVAEREQDSTRQPAAIQHENGRVAFKILGAATPGTSTTPPTKRAEQDNDRA